MTVPPARLVGYDTFFKGRSRLPSVGLRAGLLVTFDRLRDDKNILPF